MSAGRAPATPAEDVYRRGIIIIGIIYTVIGNIIPPYILNPACIEL